MHTHHLSHRKFPLLSKLPLIILALLILLVASNVTKADVVKPALIEISVHTTEAIEIEIRTSIEALLTGINGQYKNTQDAPTAEKYDQLRVLQADELASRFQPFQPSFIKKIKLTEDDKPIELSIKRIEIPEPGYTKVPRTSIIYLQGNLDRSVESLRWYYPASFGDQAVRVRQVDEANNQWHWSDWQWIRDDSFSKPFPLTELFTQPSPWQVISAYVVIGFEHIIPLGIDHILFILGIFLLSTCIKPLLWQVTMFTIAHSITLGLAMNGIITISAHIVEPLIALSIAYIGIENVFAKNLHRSRLLLVFVFGLLHGLGFASVLSEFGMPDEDFMTALISFNIGVELGQLAIIAVAFLLVFPLIKKAWYRKVITIPGSLMIAAIGLYWTFERLEWLS